MKSLLTKTAALVAGAGLLFLSAGAALAASPSLYGGASAVTGAVRLVSNTGNSSSADDYSGIYFPIASSTTLADLGPLSAKYNVTVGDCGGGSPRFQINVTNGTSTGNIFAYLGPTPNYTGCTLNSATTTGNLLSASYTLDTSQLPGGTAYDTYSHALSAYGDYTVNGVELVADGGWAVSGNSQTVRIPNVTIGSMLYDLSNFGSTTASTTLMAPTIISPSNGATLGSDAFTSVTWNAVNSSSTPVVYYYEVSNASTTSSTTGAFTSPVYQSGALTQPMIDTTGTAPGTYYYHVMAMDNAGTMSAWSPTYAVTVTSAATSPLDELIAALQALMNSFPDFSSQIQGLITQLGSNTGTTTPPVNPTGATLDNSNITVGSGGSVDFVGRNFGHEEQVTVMMNGNTVSTVHADGGGNFSTGSLSTPSTPGTYTYTFTGQNSGDVLTATVTVTS